MEKQKKAGVLYCVCAAASKEECGKCEKGKALKPTQIFNAPAWAKKDWAGITPPTDTTSTLKQ